METTEDEHSQTTMISISHSGSSGVVTESPTAFTSGDAIAITMTISQSTSPKVVTEHPPSSEVVTESPTSLLPGFGITTVTMPNSISTTTARQTKSETLSFSSTSAQTGTTSSSYSSMPDLSGMSISSSGIIASLDSSSTSSTPLGDFTISKSPASSTTLAIPQSDGAAISPGGIAGISTGCTIIVLAAIGFFVREQRKRRELAVRVSAAAYEKAELDGRPTLNRRFIDIAELTGDGIVRELEGSMPAQGNENACKT